MGGLSGVKSRELLSWVPVFGGLLTGVFGPGGLCPPPLPTNPQKQLFTVTLSATHVPFGGFVATIVRVPSIAVPPAGAAHFIGGVKNSSVVRTTKRRQTGHQ